MANTSLQIDTKTFKIKNNVMWFPDYFVQLSNVTQVSTSETQKESYPVLAFGLLILGLPLLMSGNVLFIVLGLIFIAVGAYMIYKVYQRNSAPGHDVYLQLCSGTTFRFHCPNKQHADKVMAALKECIDNKKNEEITISCVDSNVIVGNSNTQTTVG